jgi:hypothetical protein
MASKKDLVEHSPYDNRPRDRMSHDEMMSLIERAVTTVFVRLRKDGHPVGAVVASRVMDGEVYTCTNLFRAAYWNILNDDRCSVVFNHPDASVTIIGRAEIVDDPDMVERFFQRPQARNTPVHGGKVSNEQFLEWATSPNRRLFHIVPEKFFSTDMRALSSPEEVDEWLAHGKSFGGFGTWRPPGE